VERNTNDVDRGSPARLTCLAPPRLGRGCVLVVDDDAFARTVLGDAMRTRGFTVIEAASARQALGTVVRAQEPPVLVMTDLVMPDMDGRAFLGLLRASRRDVPIVIVSARVVRGVERELEREGADAVLDKSWGPSTIAEIAEGLLVMQGRRAA